MGRANNKTELVAMLLCLKVGGVIDSGQTLSWHSGGTDVLYLLKEILSPLQSGGGIIGGSSCLSGRYVRSLRRLSPSPVSRRSSSLKLSCGVSWKIACGALSLFP